MKENVLKELNRQLNTELYSAYLYLSMAAYLETQNLSGFSNWMKVQFEEEQAHAMKLFQYIIDRGAEVKLISIETPQTEWNGIIDVFEHVLRHEQSITNSINDIFDLALKEKDHATVNTLQWFVKEQVEEEAGVSDILKSLMMIDGKGTGLFLLDREMKQRQFQPLI